MNRLSSLLTSHLVTSPLQSPYMIGFLLGTVHHIDGTKLILLTEGGVGYEVQATGGVLAEAKLGKPLQVHIYTVVREQEISLYGFSTVAEKGFFTKLLSVSGIGPKIALQITSNPMGEFLNAVERGDDAFIARTPGIGKKMAQKIILELQGKLDLSPESQATSQTQTEAVEALKGLGYDEGTINFVLKKAPKDIDTEALIKFFLTKNF